MIYVKLTWNARLQLDLSSSLSCSTQFRLSFSVELSWKELIQLNWVESDSQFNSVNLTSCLELDCRSTFYQIFYHILYYTLYYISHHIFIIFLTIFSIIFLTNLSIKFSTKLIAKSIAKKKLGKKRKSILFLVHSILYLVTKIEFKQLNSILNWAWVERDQFNLNSNSDLSWVDRNQLNSTLTWRQIYLQQISQNFIDT